MLSSLITKLRFRFSRRVGRTFDLSRVIDGKSDDPRRMDISRNDQVVFQIGNYRREFRIAKGGRLGSGNLCLIFDIGSGQALRVNVKRDALTHFIQAQRLLVSGGVPVVQIQEYFSTANRTYFAIVEKLEVIGTLVDVYEAFCESFTGDFKNPMAIRRIRLLGEEAIFNLLVDFAGTTALFSMIDDLNAINLVLARRKKGPLHFCVIDTGRVEPVDTNIAKPWDIKSHSTFLNNPTIYKSLTGNLNHWKKACHSAIVEKRKKKDFPQRVAELQARIIPPTLQAQPKVQREAGLREYQ